MCIVSISVNLISCVCVSCLSQDSLRINIIKWNSNDGGNHLGCDENQIWNRNPTYYESFNTNDVQSGMLQFGSKSILVREHRNKIIVTDAYTHSNYVEHVSGWSKRLQCAAVVPFRGTNFLFVIKGYRTYHNYSRIHIFNEDFNCCGEKEINGRNWEIMGVSCKDDCASILMRQYEECVMVNFDIRKEDDNN